MLFATGCVPAAEWMARSSRRLAPVAAAVALNAAASIVIGLPVIPVDELGETPIPATNPVARDAVGWPTYVRQIASVYEELPPSDRARAVVLTSNYGEAGAVARYGPDPGLPRVYSGHNELHDQATPPDSATVVVVVGGQMEEMLRQFRSCEVRALLDNGVGVDNEEQGQPVAVCRDPVGGWSSVWPELAHLD